MIPEVKRPAVRRALYEAFGAQEFEDIRLLTVGHASALAFRTALRSKSHLLRIIMRSDGVSDPTRQFACMKIAAQAVARAGDIHASVFK